MATKKEEVIQEAETTKNTSKGYTIAIVILVLIIIALISIIAVLFAIGIIAFTKDSKEKAFDSINNTTWIYYQNNEEANVKFEFLDNKAYKLSFEDDDPVEGHYLIVDNKHIVLSAHSDEEDVDYYTYTLSFDGDTMCVNADKCSETDGIFKKVDFNNYSSNNKTTTTTVEPTTKAAEPTTKVQIDASKPTMYIFHGDGCPHCEELLNWLDSIDTSSFNIVKYEVWNDADNQTLMKNTAKKLKTDVTGVPFIVIGDKTFKGFGEGSKDEILEVIKDYNKNMKSYKDMVK